jgi:hypothetical protein
MSVSGGPSIVTSGLIHVLDPNQYGGVANTTFSDRITTTNYWTIQSGALGNTAAVKTILTNGDSTGFGNTKINIAPVTTMNTGSITTIVWFNLKNITLDPGDQNNYRNFIMNKDGSGGSPMIVYLEQSAGGIGVPASGGVTYSCYFTDGVFRRYTANVFSETTYDANGWQMMCQTYDKATGNNAVYKNGVLAIQGPMMTNGSGANPTTPGLGLEYKTYEGVAGSQYAGFSICTAANTAPNPSGLGSVPGEIGSVLFYNRALSAEEVLINYNAMRSRYGL